MERSVSILSNKVNEKTAIPVITLKSKLLHSNAAIDNQWYNQIGKIIGALDQNFIVNSVGEYYDIVSLQGCKSAPSETERILQTDTDVAKNNLPIYVYPNPFSSEILFELERSKGILKFFWSCHFKE